ncbi:MAG: intradiol ring-cleavage dioxygenase [Cyanobacteria bacterium P01_F01_bin.53]
MHHFLRLKQWRVNTSRRSFLKKSVPAIASLTLVTCGRPSANSEVDADANSQTQAQTQAQELPPTLACGDTSATPSQTAGPFFTPDSPERASLLEPGITGTTIVLSGQVLSPNCEPIANALLDFWQADSEGQYDNKGYTLRGHQFTDGQGRYRLETVEPGMYPGRTRHFHVKVQAPAQQFLLTTQLYFPQEALNDRDGLFQPELLMAVSETDVAGQPSETFAKKATFDFVLSRLA